MDEEITLEELQNAKSQVETVMSLNLSGVPRGLMALLPVIRQVLNEAIDDKEIEDDPGPTQTKVESKDEESQKHPYHPDPYHLGVVSKPAVPSDTSGIEDVPLVE